MQCRADARGQAQRQCRRERGEEVGGQRAGRGGWEGAALVLVRPQCLSQRAAIPVNAARSIVPANNLVLGEGGVARSEGRPVGGGEGGAGGQRVARRRREALLPAPHTPQHNTHRSIEHDQSAPSSMSCAA